MVERTFVIAECGSSWNFGLDPIGNAYRMIEAAKACDASAVKFQFTSDATAMAKRRGLGADAEAMYRRYLQYPVEYLHKFKAKCDEVGLEFMTTVFLIEDIPTIAPLVSRFKISAFEAKWVEFVVAHEPYEKDVIISRNPFTRVEYWLAVKHNMTIETIHCISKYPTPIEELGLHWIRDEELYGLSDHSTSVLTGALAVAAGGRIVEKHVRLSDTPKDNPDYGHSLVVNFLDARYSLNQDRCFKEYVKNIRETERAM